LQEILSQQIVNLCTALPIRDISQTVFHLDDFYPRQQFMLQKQKLLPVILIQDFIGIYGIVIFLGSFGKSEIPCR
jgi:hypothetical protein